MNNFKEPINKECINKECLKKEPIKKESINKEPINKGVYNFEIDYEMISYNDYFINKGINYIIEKHHLVDDPLIYLILEDIKLETPLDDWIKHFGSNKKNDIINIDE